MIVRGAVARYKLTAIGELWGVCRERIHAARCILLIPRIRARINISQKYGATDAVIGTIRVKLVAQRCRCVLRCMFSVVIKTHYVIELWKTADSLELLAKLMLSKERQAVATKISIRGERASGGAARVVPLISANSSPRGDRSQLESWRELVL